MKSGMSMWKQMVMALAAVLFAGVMLVAFPEPAFAAKKNIASGKSGNISWVIDANGKLTVTGTGEVPRMDATYDESYNLGEEILTTIRVPEWYENCDSIESAVINVTGMTDASYLFYSCYNLESVNLSGFDTSTVTDMSYMFYDCWGLQELDVSKFDTSNVRDMSYMFFDCGENGELKKLDVSGFDTSKVTNMSYMFYNGCWLSELDVSKFNTSNVTDMSNMFLNCGRYGELTKLDVTGFNTSKVKDMSGMFYGCKYLTVLDVSGFKTGKVTDMGSMFEGCLSLTELNLSNFDTSNVTHMTGMFCDCKSLTELDLSNFNASNAEDMQYMFYRCSSLTTIYSPKNVACYADVVTDDDYAWCLPNGTVVTEVPKNSSKSVKLTRKPQYTENNTTIKLSATSFTYTGKALKPTVTVKDSNGKKISSKYYTVTYKNNKKVGKATLTIKFKGDYTGTITKTFKINPKATSLKKVTSAKTKTLTVTWKKQATQTTGYEIQYSTSKNFTKKTTKTATVKSTKTTSTTIKKLSAKKKYYVRIRTYKTVGGKKYYSDWSKAKAVKTK
jgi:surface protein